MTPNDNNGRKIKAVYWPDTESEQGRHIPAGQEYGELVFVSSYHGDRDEHWIVQIKDGREVARHNPRYVESIQWMPDEGVSERLVDELSDTKKEVTDLEDDRRRLIQHAAEVAHAIKTDDIDYANCSYRSLPPHLQADITEQEERIDIRESGEGDHEGSAG